MATLFRISMTQAEYNAYIAVPTNIIPSNYSVLISDAAAGTSNLIVGDGTNTPVESNVGGSGAVSVFEDWKANEPYAIGDKTLATVIIGAIGVGSRLRRKNAGTSRSTFDATEALEWDEMVIDDDVIPKTDIVNDLTTGGTTKVLSAEQGKTLATTVDGKSAGIANNNLTDNTFTILSTGKYKINQTLNFGGSGSPTTVSVKVKVNGTAISTTSTTTTGGATSNTYSADRDLSAGDVVSFTTQPTNASQKIDSKTASIQDISGTKTLSSMASTTVQLLAASEEVADYLTGSSNIIASPVTATTTTAGLMSSTDKTKLDGVATGAEVNVQADWNQATTTADDFVKNKPTIPAATVINNTLTSTSTTEALSAAQGKALQDGKQGTSEKGVANGYAGLNASGIIPSAQMPSLATTTVTSIAPILGANIGLPGYRRSKLIPISSTTTGSGDYQVELAIGESALSVGATFHLAGNSQDFPTAHKDSGEFAFVKPDGTQIPFWVAEVTGTAPNRTARVYLRMAGLTGQATSVQSLVFMLYDNNLMTIPSQMSAITSVFNLLADDWDGASLDLAKWVATGTVPTQTGSILTFDTANTAKIVNSITTFGDGMEILHRTTFVDDSQSTSRSGFIDNTTAANDFAFGDVWSSAKSLWVGATQSALATEPNATSRLYRLSRLAGNGSFKFTNTDTVIEATRTSVPTVATPVRPWNAYGNTRGDSDWIAVRQILAVPPTVGASTDV